jgi:transcriptional regulator with XRE-family HTH domain
MTKKRTPVKLAQKLKKIRQHIGFSQDRLAEVIGRKDVSRRSRVHEWETGKSQPDLLSLLAYARLVDISTDVLIDDDMELDLSNIKQKV